MDCPKHKEIAEFIADELWLLAVHAGITSNKKEVLKHAAIPWWRFKTRRQFIALWQVFAFLAIILALRDSELTFAEEAELDLLNRFDAIAGSFEAVDNYRETMDELQELIIDDGNAPDFSQISFRIATDYCNGPAAAISINLLIVQVYDKVRKWCADMKPIVAEQLRSN